MNNDKPRISVITPFLDKKHGSERCLAEQVERIAHRFEVHIYAHYVEDIDLSNGNISVRHIPQIPGPHIIKYLWFFVANHIWRAYDSMFSGLRYPVRYSPCINCLDANVIAVHIIFHAFCEARSHNLRRGQTPFRSWPRMVHRWLYYKLLMFLERHVYGNEDVAMICVSEKTRRDMKRYFDRSEAKDVVIYHGIDCSYFNPASRRMIRDTERQNLGISNDEFVLLLIGNDWVEKGLATLIDAMALLSHLKLKALVVGQDSQDHFAEQICRAQLKDRILFCPPDDHVLRFYAAADAYVAPSLEDAFAMPPMEAMACGLPAVVSRRAGLSELITDEYDGLILQNPTNAHELAVIIQRLYQHPELCQVIGENASKTARKHTWDRNAETLMDVFDLVSKRSFAGRKTPFAVR